MDHVSGSIDDRYREPGMMNYYALLGVEVDASFEEIYSMYRRLAREYHPDGTIRRKKRRKESPPQKEDSLQREDEANMFQLLCEAKDVLTDEEKRKAYNVKLLGDERKKWVGSEARQFEDSFYHDLQTQTSKGHTEKPQPIVVRTQISLAKWMQYSEVGEEGFPIEYEKHETCAECYGYNYMPRRRRINGEEEISSSAKPLYGWNPMEYTVECTACTGMGFTLKDSSVQAKNRASSGNSERIVHDTPEGYSTTITAEIRSCSHCKGMKRVFAPSAMIDECNECDGYGTCFQTRTCLRVPFPRHFDAETKTSILVLMGEGHQWRANQTPGDVHVIFELQMPESTMVLRELPIRARRVSEESIPSSQEPSQHEEDGDEPSQEEEEDLSVVSTYFTMDLAISKDGKHFDVPCSINLRQAICGFSAHVPTYWMEERPGFPFPPAVFTIPRGAYTWTQDVWKVDGLGPGTCELCTMPCFLWPSKDPVEDSSVHKVLGRYPGFAPFLLARSTGSSKEGSSTRRWEFPGCGVSRQRYPTHPGNSHTSLHRPVTPIDPKERASEDVGALRLVFTVSAPVLPSQGDHPDMFYRTFAWCCGKLEERRLPTVYGCS